MVYSKWFAIFPALCDMQHIQYFVAKKKRGRKEACYTHIRHPTFFSPDYFWKCTKKILLLSNEVGYIVASIGNPLFYFTFLTKKNWEHFLFLVRCFVGARWRYLCGASMTFSINIFSLVTFLNLQKLDLSFSSFSSSFESNIREESLIVNIPFSDCFKLSVCTQKEPVW